MACLLAASMSAAPVGSCLVPLGALGAPGRTPRGRDRSHAASPPTAAARVITVQRKAKASGPLRAPLEVTAAKKRRTKSTPKKVLIAVIIACNDKEHSHRCGVL